MIWDKLQSEFGYSDIEVSQIKYVIDSVSSEFSKLFIMGIIFLLLNHFPEYITSVVVLLCVRTNSGGLHFKHYFSCLLFSFLLLILSIIIIPSLLAVSKPFMLINLVFCIIISFLLEPVRNIYRPASDKKLLKMCHLNTFKYIFIFLLITYVLPLNPLIIAGFWTINLQMLQLIAANIIKKGGDYH